MVIIHIYKKERGVGMPQTMQSLIERYVSEIHKIYGSHVKQIILYGSYARGDFRDNSDIDLMVLVIDMSEDEIRSAEEALCNMAFDIELEESIHISAIVKDEIQFEMWNDTLPFYGNVKREGIEVSTE